jgi:hypothetical protein
MIEYAEENLSDTAYQKRLQQIKKHMNDKDTLDGLDPSSSQLRKVDCPTF